MKVSVLVPTHQRPALLREALASIGKSTMSPYDYEVIVANDDATDLAPDVLNGMQGVVLEGPFGGQSAALNAALQRATGEYLTVAHDDDLVLPHKLRGLAKALDACGPETVATFGSPVYTTNEGVALGCPEKVRDFMRRHPVVTSAIALADGLYVHGTAPMYRTAAVRAVGGWDEAMPTAEEWDLHHRLLAFQGDFRAVDLAVVTYRAGGKSTVYKQTKRPRAVMNRTYDKLRAARPEARGKVTV